MVSDDYKPIFASLWAKTGDAYAAAMQTVGKPGEALWIFRNWLEDEEVLTLFKESKTKFGNNEEKPNREDFAVEVLRRGRTAFDDETAFKMLKLYADVMGFIQKPDTNINNNIDNKVKSNVVVVRDHGSDSDWEKKASEQQAKLQETPADA